MTQREANSIRNLYQQFFKQRRCKQLTLLVNQHSVADALITSGTSDSRLVNVLWEYKDRRFSVSQYDTSMIELEKIKNLQASMRLLDAPAFLIFEYNEVVLVFNVELDRIYAHRLKLCPKTTEFGNTEMVLKPCTFFEYDQAEYIISKRTWNIGNKEQLLDYIKTKRNEYNRTA